MIEKKIVKIALLLIFILLVLIVIVTAWDKGIRQADMLRYNEKLLQVEREMRKECSMLGIETLYINKDTSPYSYYCLDLPGVGGIGTILLLEPPLLAKGNL